MYEEGQHLGSVVHWKAAGMPEGNQMVSPLALYSHCNQYTDHLGPYFL